MAALVTRLVVPTARIPRVGWALRRLWSRLTAVVRRSVSLLGPPGRTTAGAEGRGPDLVMEDQLALR
jgi:hypothetical protein